MHIDEVNWIAAHNYGSAEMTFIHAYSLSWKGEILGLDIVSQILEHKLLNQNWWSWYNFSKDREDTPSTNTSYCISTYYEKYAVPFLLCHPV